MSQVQNLLDMFLNNRKNVQAKSPKASESKSQSSGAQGDLLPLESAGKGAAPRSFQSKIKESRAKLAAKTGNAAPQNRTPDLKTDRHASHDDGARRSEEARSARGARTGNAERPDQRRPKFAAASKAGQAGDRDADTVERSGPNEAGARPAQAQSEPQKPAAGFRPEGDASGPDAAAAQALKDGLESLGLRINDEQLQDPAFLRDLLQMLQALPLAADTGMDIAEPDTVTDVISAVDGPPRETETGMDAVPAQNTVVPTQADGDPGQAHETYASLQSLLASVFPELVLQADAAGTGPEAEPAAALPADTLSQAPAAAKPADRDGLAALVRSRIEEMTGHSAEAARGQAAVPATNMAPTPTPSGWQGIEVRPRTESVSTEPLPMADLDRLRVLQSAALQAGNAGLEIEADPLPQSGEAADPMESIGETGNALSAVDGNAQADGGDAGLPGNEAGLSGGNGDASRNAEASLRKDGPLAAKDAGAGPQFLTNLEQARAVEHRPGIERAWEPRPAMEPSALEQIARKMSAIGHKNGEEINIHLSPEHLGKVRVSLEMKDGAMSARIAVENDNVRQQVEAGLSALKDALENQGIKLQGLEVSVDQRHGSLFNPDGSNAESFFHRNGKGGRSGAEGGAETAPFESAPESDTGRRLGYNTMEYIG